jgi:thiol:disulfide interchange protein
MSYTGARKLRADDYPEARRERRLSLVDSVDLEYTPTFAENGRRTVKITGQPTPARKRPARAQAQIQARPDRIVLWAFLLGMFLVFMAVATANAATL